MDMFLVGFDWRTFVGEFSFAHLTSHKKCLCGPRGQPGNEGGGDDWLVGLENFLGFYCTLFRFTYIQSSTIRLSFPPAAAFPPSRSIPLSPICSKICLNLSPKMDHSQANIPHQNRQSNPINLFIMPIFLLLFSHFPLPINATFSWPKARIPYEEDPKLTADPDMAVALNNARMDLQVRTCIRLVPRRGEQDYVYFSDLGPHIECWNMFEPYPPKGRIPVNAGNSCLEPMRRPHRPKRVFSECDIEYVNHLYNCPKRRKPSPICPAGRLIMARPSELMTRTTTPAAESESRFSEGGLELEGQKPEGQIGEADEETTTNGMWSTTTISTFDEMTTSQQLGEEFEGGSTTTMETGEMVDELLNIETTTIVEEMMETTTNGDMEITTTTTTTMGDEEETTTTGKIDEMITETTTTKIEEKTTMMKTTTSEMESIGTTTLCEKEEEMGTTIPNKMEEMDTSTVTTIEEKQQWATISTDAWTEKLTSNHTMPPLISETVGEHWTSKIPAATSTDAGKEVDKDGIRSPSPLPEPDEPLATARSETRHPYPLMMTLITTTTTTTIAPPPPAWVRSVEESFRAEERLNSGEEAPGDGWRPLSTLSTPASSPTTDQPHSGEQIIGRTGPPEPMPIKPEKGRKSGSKESEVNEAGGHKHGNGGGISITENVEDGGGQRPVALLGLIKLPPGAAISIREKTRVTKLVEKTKYIGPCGSACTYGGQLVRLYRSFNSNPQVSDHFYTTERLEQHLMASQGFLMEPSMGFLGRNQVDTNCSCIRPLYRLYSAFSKDHFLTANDQEKAVAETLLGFVYERILGYCTREPGCGAYLPLYRFYNAISKDHFYTVDQQEMHYYKTHTELAYGFEKIECYVWQHSSSAKGCPALTLMDIEEERRRENNKGDSSSSSIERN